MQSFLARLYIFRFLEAFKFIGVIFTLFFAAHGLDTFQISLLITIWSATQLILEVPFGVIADLYPRRNVLILSLLLLIVGFGFWLKGGFLFYAVGFVFWGMKNALMSGTFEAFVYDELKFYKSEKLYEKINGRLDAIFWTGLAVSSALGGLLASIDYSLVILGTIMTLILAILTLFLIRPVQPSRSTGEVSYFVTLKDALKEFGRNRTLQLLTIFFCLLFASYGAADEYWALIFQELKINPGLIGILLAAAYGIFSLAGYTVHYIKQKNIQYILLIASSFLFIILGVTVSPLVFILLLFLVFYLFKIAHLKIDAFFQHSIASGERATISSLKSLLYEIIYILFVLSFGFIGNNLSVLKIPLILGVLIFVFSILFSSLSRKLSPND